MTEYEVFTDTALEDKRAGLSGARLIGVEQITGLVGSQGDWLYNVLATISLRLGQALTRSYRVGSESAMLALDAGTGDVALRTDLSRSFILAAEPANILENWLELLTPASAAAPATQTVLLRDDFSGAALDASLWTSSGNVSVAGGLLRFRTAAGTFTGGEIKSTLPIHKYGSYTARIKACAGVGALTAFYLLVEPLFHSEVDIEIVASQRRADFGAYYGPPVNPEPTHVHQIRSVTLPFDPSADFHEYRFDYAPDFISFYVDGKLYYLVDKSIPEGSMHLQASLWWPTWVTPRVAPGTDVFADFDFIEKRTLPDADTTRPHGPTHAIDGPDPLDVKEVGAQRVGFEDRPADQGHVVTIDSAPTQFFNAPALTNHRNVTLSRPPAGKYVGQRVRVVREAVNTGGPWELRVFDGGAGQLRALLSGQWADFEWGGSSWALVASGWLY
jgi:endo-1,3-1,4-beta-glycanase ExoK